MNKLVLPTLAILLVALACSPVYAINWQLCAQSANHHCTIIMPTAVKSASPNYFVTVNFPQNGSPVLSGVLSNPNYTALQNSVGVMRVQSTATSSSPNINFCPIALIELENQGTPEYLDHFYNKSTGLNLTHYIYPDYCYSETGPNPIDGSSHPIPVPEFSGSSMIILGLALASFAGIAAAKKFKV